MTGENVTFKYCVSPNEWILALFEIFLIPGITLFKNIRLKGFPLAGKNLRLVLIYH